MRARSSGLPVRFKEGDYVLTYLKAEREYLVGTVTGPYQYCPGAFDADYPYVGRVDWQG